MMARATGAFLVALIAIFYLFGDFEGGTDFALALVGALLIGLGVAYWLERDERAGAPDVFDEKATKRAVRRGILRTALVAVLWVIFGLVIAGCASTAWQTRGDRIDHVRDVVTHGFGAAHPGFTDPELASCCPTGLRSTTFEIDVRPRSAQPVIPTTRLKFEIDLRGRLDPDWPRRPPRTAVDVASERAADKADARRVVDRLPASVVATAVVELAEPLDVRRFHELLARHGLHYPNAYEVGVYLEAPQSPHAPPEGIHLDNRVSWPRPALAEFQAWVKTLRSSDDGTLDVLGLPGHHRLRELAGDPRVFGLVLDAASPALLRSLLDDPAVSGAGVGDVAFDLDLATDGQP